MRNWDYCPARARTELCRLLSRVDVPISFGESTAFEEYIKILITLSLLLSLHKPQLGTWPNSLLKEKLS